VVADKNETPKKEPDRGQPVNGLSLALSAERTELTPGPDGKIEPITLQLRLHNEGKEVLRIKTDNLLPTWEGRVELTVTGPADGVGVDEQDGSNPPAKPAMGFFHPLPAGQSKRAGECKFPGPLPPGANGKVVAYSLTKPGKYRVRAAYSNFDQDPLPIAAGAWTGTATSNDLVITVRPAPRPTRK
jgi:hypothetical protein